MRINPGAATDWGAEIRRFRRLRAVKQATLAEMLGVDQTTVSRWESNRQEPDLGIQRRLRALMQGTGTRDEALLRHWVETAVGDTVLLDASRALIVGSATFLARHGIDVPTPPALSLLPMFSEELDRAWWYAVERGFFEGEVASLRVLGRLNLLSGDDALTARSVWVPVALNDGGVLCRIDTVIVDDASFLGSTSNTIELVTVNELGG